MRLLSCEGMRDVDIGICWDAGYIGICGIGGEDGGYAEICGICGDMWDMRRYVGYAGRTTSPKSARPGCRFWSRPPDLRRSGNENGKRPANRKKKNVYFAFNLLIINHINQYFNIYLHLIRFITYNRQIFIAKYLLDNKTCSIFAPVR